MEGSDDATESWKMPVTEIAEEKNPDKGLLVQGSASLKIFWRVPGP